MLAAMWRVLLLSLTVLLAVFSPASDSAAAPSERIAYVERVLGGAPDDRLPMVVAIHGLGSSPDDLLSLFDGLDVPVRIIAPRAPDPWQVGTSWYPIDDPARATQVVRKRADALNALIAGLEKQRPTLGRAIVTGFSQGGVLSFALAAYHPQRLTAAIPLAGMLRPTMPAFRKAPADFRLIALHGRDDRRIEYAAAEQTVARFTRAGTRASLEGFVGVGHGVSPAMLARFHAVLREQLARVRAP